ncbi:cyclic nucleotide-binding domain-containing protein [Aurantimonas sp. VKM B-3413]|uniref:cyclic nucleotide-binding domain-containing protein n=1 Tax=Aurantimonas sp. VKM B-3413 TaxID=2779401 RepID=UPI001E443894|nr:cyclic nucleotide-binding domain-containing protein [Aurantimonas sp. VKM B-3413]MCB8837722.1 cyclic nucleotide-binding domain-containing protein [Aurantimonas sp. VKM B-3413]
MSLESDIAILRTVPLFDGLETDQLRLLAFGAEHRRLHANEFLFRENARADAGFVVVSGEVSLLHGRGEAERVIGTYGPGTLLGELALITETKRPASAKTLSECNVIRITRPLFRRMLEEYPEFAAGLHERLRVQLEDMMAQILSLEGRFS